MVARSSINETSITYSQVMVNAVNFLHGILLNESHFMLDLTKCSFKRVGFSWGVLGQVKKYAIKVQFL